MLLLQVPAMNTDHQPVNKRARVDNSRGCWGLFSGGILKFIKSSHWGQGQGLYNRLYGPCMASMVDKPLLPCFSHNRLLPTTPVPPHQTSYQYPYELVRRPLIEDSEAIFNDANLTRHILSRLYCSAYRKIFRGELTNADVLILVGQRQPRVIP